MTQSVIDELLHGPDPSGPPSQATVQPYRHHAWRTCAFLIERVKGVAQVTQKLLPGVESLGRSETHVVRIQGVRHYQVVCALNLGPERQIIVVVVGVIQEPPFLDYQTPGILTGSTGIPTQWPLTGESLDDLDRLVQMLTFDLIGYVAVVDPAIAV